MYAVKALFKNLSGGKRYWLLNFLYFIFKYLLGFKIGVNDLLRISIQKGVI